MGQVEYAVGGLAEVEPGGADGVHVDVAPQHAGMLVELAEAVSPSTIGDACAHSTAGSRFGASPNCTSIPRGVGARR